MRICRVTLRSMFVCVFFILLALPLVCHVLSPLQKMSGKTFNENRVLASATIPSTAEDFIQFPATLQSWINDRFTLKSWFVYLNNNIHFSLFNDIPRFGKQIVFGQEGYIFLASHSVSSPLSLLIQASGITDFFPMKGARFTHLLKKAETISDRLVYVSVPTKHVLDTEHYPLWLADLAVKRRDSVTRALTALQEQTAGKFLYPYKEAIELRKHHQLIPKTFFHWIPGPYTRMVAGLVAKQLKIVKEYEADGSAYVKENRRSDIHYLYPGLTIFTSSVETYSKNHFRNIGIVKERFNFYDHASMPRVLRVMQGSFLLKNSNIKSSNKLLLIGDSFASAISEDLAIYFGQVVHITRNEFGQLTPEEQKLYIDGVLKNFKPTHCVQLTHSGHLEVFDEYISNFFTDSMNLDDGMVR